MSAEKNLTTSPTPRKPAYCGVGSCDNTPGHDGIHRCRCGKPVDAPANGCGWHQAPGPFLDGADLPTLRKLHEFMSNVEKSSDSKVKKMMFEMFAAILGDFVREIESGVSS